MDEIVRRVDAFERHVERRRLESVSGAKLDAWPASPFEYLDVPRASAHTTAVRAKKHHEIGAYVAAGPEDQVEFGHSVCPVRA